jgi:hypothetical protein
LWCALVIRPLDDVVRFAVFSEALLRVALMFVLDIAAYTASAHCARPRLPSTSRAGQLRHPHVSLEDSLGVDFLDRDSETYLATAKDN